MTYKLKFLPSAKKEWDKLDNSIKSQFKSKLKNCLENPCVPANKLRDFDCAYKIKLDRPGIAWITKLIIMKSLFLLLP